jgi:uncharacterized protein YecE (DUF72 family)
MPLSSEPSRPMPFDRNSLKTSLAALAEKGILIGTSSWKYPGWFGQLYEQDRYVWHGRFSEARFEKRCLSEYAAVFKTVCVDAAYYKFPDSRHLEELTSQVPDDFRFAFKVTHQITTKRFPSLPRFGDRAGRQNHDFLNPALFESEFLSTCQPHQKKIGLLIFEFSRFSREDFPQGREFVEALDQFLGRLPRKWWQFGVEIRNRTFLQPEYFATLARHGAIHVFNSWQDMPPVEEQLRLAASLTNPSCLAGRFLLRPGRRYEEAVKLLKPYDSVKDPYPKGQAAGADLIKTALRSGRKALIYVNNRFEGNALQTIAAMIERAQVE